MYGNKPVGNKKSLLKKDEVETIVSPFYFVISSDRDANYGDSSDFEMHESKQQALDYIKRRMSKQESPSLGDYCLIVGREMKLEPVKVITEIKCT